MAPVETTLPSGNATGSREEQAVVVETDLLIIGAGPAGASLACFLAQHGRNSFGKSELNVDNTPGLKGIMLAATPGTADTPRAHITNMAALECLRDIGLEQECLQVAVKGDCMQHTRWCRSMAGEEFARIYSWGNDPQRAVSPFPICRGCGRAGAILIVPRAIMMQPLPANMSISLKPSSSLSSFTML
jgi:hypothetical protein